MPVYRYRCLKCESECDGFNRVAEYRTHAPICCDERMDIRIMPVMGFVQADVAYKSPLSDAVVTSHRQRRYEMDKFEVVDGRDFDLKNTVRKKTAEKAEREELAAQLPQLPKGAVIPPGPNKAEEWNKNSRRHLRHDEKPV